MYYSDLKLLGITDAKKKQLLKKGIRDITDLLLFLPRKYTNYGIPGEPKEGKAAVLFRLTYVTNKVTNSGIDMLCALGTANEKKISVVWFRQKFRYEEVYRMKGRNVLAAGDFHYDESWDQYQVANPDIFSICSPQPANPVIFPAYSKISGMSDSYLRVILKKAIEGFINCVQQELPRVIENRLSLMTMEDALKEAHFPTGEDNLREAWRRLRAEKFFYFAMQMRGEKVRKSSPFKARSDLLQQNLMSSLPYHLTDDQKKTVDELSMQMRQGKSVHALIQGDVGCGKSVVAFLLIALMAENGFQSVLMAPTTVLARQHYEDLETLFSPYGICVEYVRPLTSMKKKEKMEMEERISKGKCQIVVGTHALLSDDLEYHGLGLIITDEEHKFGVEQREKLRSKTSDGVHYVTMSATPIPRSLAGVIYGEETKPYFIRTMPAGRKPVQTAVSRSYNSCFSFLKKQLQKGRQAYIVCPQVDQDQSDIASVEELTRKYEDVFGKEAVSSLTARNTKKETEEILTAFKENRIRILVATTVIEVGVNVPNANTIIIHNAERFGLASLHQLRGRVGRGGGDAYCILFSKEKENPRLMAMCATTDGFRIAEEDLKLRGAGDLFGTEQSGMNEYIELILDHPGEYKDICDAIKKLF